MQIDELGQWWISISINYEIPFIYSLIIIVSLKYRKWFIGVSLLWQR